LSDPFYRGAHCLFDTGLIDESECRLCWFEAKNPSGLRSCPDAKKKGRLMQGSSCVCSEEKSKHTFHLQCIEAFIMTNRHIEAVTQMCPTCKAADEDLGDLIKIDDRLSLGGAARNRVRSKYMCWIHIIQAAGLKVKDSTKAIKPVDKLHFCLFTQLHALGCEYLCLGSIAHH